MLGTHSCKTTLLSWAQQLQLPLEQRQLQGHHRSQLNGSVALYSRNDTLPALILQYTIAQRIAEGFRPLRPLLRGGLLRFLIFRFRCHLGSLWPSSLSRRKRLTPSHRQRRIPLPVRHWLLRLRTPIFLRMMWMSSHSLCRMWTLLRSLHTW